MGLIFRKFFLFLTISLSSLFAIGTQFLALPSHAYELALGSHVATGGSSIINPALINSSEIYPSLLFDSGQWHGGIKSSSASYNRKIKGINNHIFLQQAGITDLEFREDRPSDDPGSKFGAYGISFGTGISKNTSFGVIGINIRTIYFSIYDENSNGISFDLGYSIKLNNNFDIGLSIVNIGSVSKFQNEHPKLPVRALIGLSKNVNVINNIEDKLFITADYYFVQENWKINIGNFAKWRKFIFLSGYSISKNTSSYSFGTGFNYGRFSVTYGVRIGSQNIGVPKTISISFRMP